MRRFPCPGMGQPEAEADQLAVSLPIPMGTAMEGWRPVVEEDASGLTGRKKRWQEVRREGRKATNHSHKHCGKACP